MNSASLQLVGEKLKELTERHEQLTVLRAQRRELRAAGKESPDLDVQIKLIERWCRKALDEMQEAYAAMQVSLSDSPSGFQRLET